MSPRIVFQTHGISKSFGGFRAVDDVSLSVEEAEIRAIIGPNGAGKTTFVHVISGLLKPTKGTITLNGKDITRAPAHQRTREGLARTFQITSLFRGLTVEDHVVLAMRGNDAAPRHNSSFYLDAACELLHEVGLVDKMKVQVDTLSHGDQKILEVTMALAADPTVLLLDEPTAGMSVVETAAMIELVNTRLRGKVSVIIIEHDMNVVMRTADRVTVLANGHIISDGSPAVIMADSQVSEVYLGTSDRP